MQVLKFLIFIPTIFLSSFCNKSDKNQVYYDLALAMENSILEGDPEMLNNLFSHYVLVQNVLAEHGIVEQVYIRAAAEHMKRNMRIGDQIIDATAYGAGLFQFTKLYYDGNAPHMVFRTFVSFSEINYLDFELKTVNGKPRIVDTYNFSIGEQYSKTVKNLFRLSEIHDNGFDASAITPDNVLTMSLAKVKRINNLLNYGSVQVADSLFKTIPKTIQEQKSILLAGMKIAYLKSGKDYSNAFDRYKKLYPNEERSLTLMSIYNSLLKEDGTAARVQIEKLAKFVGDDPVLNYFLSQSYYVDKDYEEGLKYANQIVEDMPYVIQAYEMELSCLVGLGDMDRSMLLLDKMKDAFNLSNKELEKLIVNFPELKNSLQFEKWKGKTI